jgi:hypothetical protein
MHKKEKKQHEILRLLLATLSLTNPSWAHDANPEISSQEKLAQRTLQMQVVTTHYQTKGVMIRYP